MKFLHAVTTLFTAGSALLIASCTAERQAQAPAASAEQVTAALTGDDATKAALVQLYQEARAAGEPGPTIYIASVPEEHKPLTDAFAEAFPGLRADYQRYIGDKLSARLDGEYASGNHTADVVLVSVIELRSLKEAGRLSAFSPANVATLDAQFRDPDGAFYSFYKKPFAVAYNTNLVRPNEVPQTIADVLNPRWRGRFTFPSSGNAASGSGNGPLLLLQEQGKVSDNQIADLFRYGAGGPPSSELLPSVAQGRYAFSLWVNAAATQAQIDRGAPLAIAFPRDLSVHTNVAGGVLSEAPNPISSRLFLTWLLTPRAQEILAQLNFYGTTTGAPSPQGYPPLSAFLNAGVVEDEAWQARLIAFHQHRLSLTN